MIKYFLKLLNFNSVILLTKKKRQIMILRESLNNNKNIKTMADLLGTGSRDIIQGTASNDAIQSLEGDDIVYGLGGDDLINGGDENDNIYGEAVFYQDKYYLLSNFSFWQEAQNQAENLGGNLVTINDAAENQFLSDTFGNEEPLWIGLTDQNEEGNFTWISGEAVTYTNWFPGEPNNFGGNENYVGINYGNTGAWNDTFNEIISRGIIEISSSVINAGDDTLNGLGGNDLINGGAGNDELYGEAAFYQGKYYLLSNFSFWQEAQNQAENLGGNLVTINDAAENQFLSDTFGNEEPLWIGFTDQNEEGNFTWISGEAVTYTNWFSEQPDNFGGNEDYAAINYINPGQWNDAPTEFAYRGIIEISSSVILAGDDTLKGEDGNDRLFAGFGNDILDGGTDFDIAYYSTIPEAITLLPTGIVNKQGAGTDQLINVEKIIGSVGQNNLIDASSATGSTSINADLANQNLVVDGLSFSSSFKVENFVNVIGTAQDDIISGDQADNQLSGNEGDDTFVGSSGNDTLDGGAGIDTLDYSSFTEAITLLRAGSINKGSAGGIDSISNIETIIGAVEQANTIDASNGISPTTFLDVNLATNSLIVNGLPTLGALSFTVQNFVNVTGTTQTDSIIGNEAANLIDGNEGDDTFVGSSGNDTLEGGAGIDTLDYSSFTEAITLLRAGSINKGSAGGIDSISNIETIIGAVGQANTIDASNGISPTTFLDVNLAANSLIVNGLPTLGSLSFTVQNFVNITGTTQADSLTGNNLVNQIIGNSGEDLLFGGEGDDFLQGGLDNDIFVLRSGNGNDTIQDFQVGFDKFGLAGLAFEDLTLTDTSSGTLIENGSEALGTVLNVNSSSITSEDFITVVV
uniref:C-type lectin domain protein n=2 Tax=Gloeothece TaxID=28070 RepID=E0UEV1_GLOV7|nr:C-type lectin domain protein [Gloeothece verrucosa PCC 7822]